MTDVEKPLSLYLEKSMIDKIDKIARQHRWYKGTGGEINRSQSARNILDFAFWMREEDPQSWDAYLTKDERD